MSPTPTIPPGAHPVLRGPRARRPEAIALVLHGGEPKNVAPVSRYDRALLRMIPFGRDIEARTHGRVGAALLRNGVRGWNGRLKSPVGDAEWALKQLRATYPDLPIGVIGHSMGGRVAYELAGHDEVSSVVALAPWLSESYAAEPFVGTPLLVVHGLQDTITDPTTSADLVSRVQAAGGLASYIGMSDGHAMLRRAPHWHRLASRFTSQHLLS